MQSHATINNQTSQAITDIRNTLTKLIISLSIPKKGKFSTQAQPNPQGQFSVGESNSYDTQL